MGDVVDFELDGSTIKMTIGVGILYKEIGMPEYVGNITATVNYSNNNFSFSNLQFTLN